MNEELGRILIYYCAVTRPAGDFDRQPKNNSQKGKCIAEEEERVGINEIDARVRRFSHRPIEPEAECDGN